MHTVRTEDAPEYLVDNVDIAEEAVIEHALGILGSRLRKPGEAFRSPASVQDYLRLYFAGMEHEVFATLWLDSQHRLIEAVPMFRGTLTQTSVYPREVVKDALRFNAAAVILAHNHPSGYAEPSRDDEIITSTLKATLDLIDVRVLDHIIVAGKGITSFAERGLI